MGVSVRVFLDEIKIELADGVKQAVLYNVGGPHPVSGDLNKAIRLTLTGIEGNVSCLLACTLERCLFPAGGLELE